MTTVTPCMFSGESYRTSAAAKTNILYKCPVFGSLAFHMGYFLGEFINARRKAVAGLYDKDAFRHSSEVFARNIESSGAKISVEGLGNLDKFDGAAVIVGNHMSLLETFLLPAMILPRRDLAFVVKKSLTTHRVFGPIMRAVDPIAVTREDPRDDLKVVLNQGVRQLKDGKSLCVFPQTTRVAGFDAKKFNSLGVKLATKAGVPLVPLALKTDFMLNGRIIKDLGAIHPERDIRFEFGAPMHQEEFENTRAMHAAVVQFIEERLRAWGMPVA
jgi:1-acyl-sn-glycerol-3-phosphate acyltransferase